MQNFHEARESLRRHVLKSSVTHHMFYGPTTDRYWGEPFKIVALNMEPYGYENMGIVEVTRDDLIEWTFDAGKTRTRTTRYTLAILSVALTCYEQNVPATRKMFELAYSNEELIKNTLDRTAYYNIRAQSNSVKPQNYAAISEVGHSETGQYIWAEIMALQPNVIFVGGKAGLAAVNQLLSPQERIQFRSSAKVGKCLIQSISHPSRPAYDPWSLAINQSISWLNEK